jgi:hypothetical protein
VVAYNTNQDCTLMKENSDVATAPQALEKEPLDYLRQSQSSATNPAGCEAWMVERERADDLFSFNSDFATTHVDAPWMQITIQVTQNKVETDEACVFANMDVWITYLSPEFLEEEFAGVLGGAGRSASSTVGSATEIDGLNYGKAREHKEDSPWCLE